MRRSLTLMITILFTFTLGTGAVAFADEEDDDPGRSGPPSHARNDDRRGSTPPEHAQNDDEGEAKKASVRTQQTGNGNGDGGGDHDGDVRTTSVATNDEDDDLGKVLLCHATSSETNPFVAIVVDANATALTGTGGHGGHEGDEILLVGEDINRAEIAGTTALADLCQDELASVDVAGGVGGGTLADALLGLLGAAGAGDADDVGGVGGGNPGDAQIGVLGAAGADDADDAGGVGGGNPGDAQIGVLGAAGADDAGGVGGGVGGAGEAQVTAVPVGGVAAGLGAIVDHWPLWALGIGLALLAGFAAMLARRAFATVPPEEG